MQYILYLIFRALVLLAQKTPFWLLYTLSDVVCFVLYKILKYRRKVVFIQLGICFPEKSAAELEVIAQETYRNMSDILVETFKGLTFKEADIYDRFRKIGEGWAVANAITAEKRSIIGTGAHYCNWEWGALAMQLYLDAPIFGIYKPIQNDYIDAFMRERRGQWGVQLRAMYQTTETLEASRGNAWAIFMVSDQGPSNVKDAHWLPFLGRETGFLHGLEKHAVHYNYPVFYFNVVRVKRGCYDATAHLLAENPAELPKGELTRRYVAKLEEVVRAAPQNWLWTHDRWKRKRS